MTKNKAETNLKRKSNLQNDLALVKKISRKVSEDCICEEQDWILKTCYSRINRLATAGVANQHSGVKSMPVLTDNEKYNTM